MKLIMLGTTEGTGLEIVPQGVEHAYAVTAFVRSPDRLKPFLEPHRADVAGFMIKAVENRSSIARIAGICN